MAESWKTKYGKAIDVIKLLSKKLPPVIAPEIAEALHNFISIVDTDLPQDEHKAEDWFVSLSEEQKQNCTVTDVWEAAIASVQQELDVGRKLAASVMANLGSDLIN